MLVLSESKFIEIPVKRLSDDLEMPLLVQENLCSTFEQLRLMLGLSDQNQFTHQKDSYQVRAQILESDKKVTSFDYVPQPISSPFAVIEEIKNSLIKEKLPSLSFT